MFAGHAQHLVGVYLSPLESEISGNRIALLDAGQLVLLELVPMEEFPLLFSCHHHMLWNLHRARKPPQLNRELITTLAAARVQDDILRRDNNDVIMRSCLEPSTTP